MRSVRRDSVPAPRVLTDSKLSGHRERQRAEVKYDHLIASGQPASGFAFEFKAYKLAEVKEALYQLFHGKCAYCESRYAGTQPMDVEHWRPKGLVHEKGQPVMKPGYYWLAADWDNLYPACIDCNRAREQRIPGQPQPVLLGKANRFPLEDETKRWKDRLSQNNESSLLIDPCHDDPQEHLEFTTDGVVLPKKQSAVEASHKGAESIEVYALNRSELVWDRCEVARQIQQRMTAIRKLATLLDRSCAEIMDSTRLTLEDLLSHEMAALRRFQEPSQPFSMMAAQLIDEFIRDLTT
ncbi:MAG: hypothetical protein O3C40_25150 [Planctomycetota bacterium]|nr:hypothetical protein [Planctomycetota bacterium]